RAPPGGYTRGVRTRGAGGPDATPGAVDLASSLIRAHGARISTPRRPAGAPGPAPAPMGRDRRGGPTAAAAKPPPGPRRAAGSPRAPGTEGGDALERYPERLHVRLSAEDKERAQEVASELGM